MTNQTRLLAVIILIGCWGYSTELAHSLQQPQSQVKVQEACEVPVELLIKEVLGKPLAQLEMMPQCFVVRDTLIEGDDASWKARTYVRHDSLWFLAETNWENQSIISRITVEHPAIHTQDGVAIGKRFQEIRAFVSPEIPSVPDGVFALRDKKNPGILYWMKIERYPQLKYGLRDIQRVPADLVIETITIDKP